MNLAFKAQDTIHDFQAFIEKVYGLPDDRLYSIWDILAQEQRFAMRALKGIRKRDLEKIKENLMIAFSWLMAISNRLHINVEEEVWNRFPGLCSYCGGCPCVCKEAKLPARRTIRGESGQKPRTLAETQKLFEKIYPAERRSLSDAGVHLAEEVGEVSEAIHNYLGQHEAHQFDEARIEIADLVSCIFGIANSLPFDVAAELAEMYSNNCHICHKAPCECSFTDVAKLAT